MMSSRHYGLLLGISLAVIVFAVTAFERNWRIAVDPQAETCINARALLIDLSDRKPQKGFLYAFTSPLSAEPVFPFGTKMVKRAAAAPGDTVAITPDETVTVNGIAAGKGLPHLKTTDAAVRRRFQGERMVPAGHWWMMGDNAKSFDSRYWGPLPQEYIYGRAYVLF